VALSVFDEKSRQPSREELTEALGASATLWDELIAHVGDAYPPITEVWNFAGARFGWSLRLRRKDRILLYMTPQTGRFQFGCVLGEKAAAAAQEQGAPKRVLALLEEAPRYAEGRGIRMPVAKPADLDAARVLAALKMGR
jgi:hypothetical protein